MFRYNFKYELKSLLRSRWLLLLSLLLLIVVLFAGYNGKEKVKERTQELKNVVLESNTNDAAMALVLDSIESGLQVSVNPRRMPNAPMNVAYNYPRVAAIPVAPLTFISTGQSDLFTHFIKPSAYGDSFSLDYSELANPIQLLFGSFDLSFVIIYILPLIIIAFSYNILSEEKEYGSLKLLASQPISIYQWIVQKTALRFFWLTLITLAVITITLLFFGFDFKTNFSAFLQLISLVCAYILFWFTIVLLVNLVVNNSAKNAVSLLAIWVFVILIIPAVVGQLANSFYPIPSRTKMITEVRELKEELSSKQDKILDNFLRDHPEYASKDGNSNYSFWHKYIASQELVEEELKPLISSYEDQLTKQQNWVRLWQYSSPAILMQQSFNNLAHTSTTHYQSYRNQVALFSKEWRNFFKPMLYGNKNFTTNDYKKLPSFTYEPPINSSVLLKVVVLLIFSVIFIFIGKQVFVKKIKKGTIIF
ncbi:DUF3526 domain-containing protein [Cellulophaga omnivescoria]|uniref:DUF3526 domain-containing protein n=1 Tax=Cellulophaga omnivescoria TaxID=1888890 RepID=UPI0022F026C1|nr:DUF3526 domain-containing protein [Cellulophaga omnivescoria]WBU90843.1 DUF3526 domain-containing protein [Cellulophaga omnivescoria]